MSNPSGPLVSHLQNGDDDNDTDTNSSNTRVVLDEMKMKTSALCLAQRRRSTPGSCAHTLDNLG